MLLYNKKQNKISNQEHLFKRKYQIIAIFFKILKVFQQFGVELTCIAYR